MNKEELIKNINELYPPIEITRYGTIIRECTKERPMNLLLADVGRWQHPKDSVHETDYDSDYWIEYKCGICGHTWKSEMPE